MSAFDIGLSPISVVDIKFSITSLVTNEIFIDKIYLQTGLSTGTTYEHPVYVPINLNATGANIITSLVTDTIGSVLSATVRTMTLDDLGYVELLPIDDILD